MQNEVNRNTLLLLLLLLLIVCQEYRQNTVKPNVKALCVDKFVTLYILFVGLQNKTEGGGGGEIYMPY